MVFHNQFDGPVHGTINQAGRDIIAPGAASSPVEALAAVAQIRAALNGVELPPEADQAARQELDAVEQELRKPEPDRDQVAGGLERATETLKTAGALAAAGAALVGPIGAVAGFLGPVGAAVLKLIR